MKKAESVKTLRNGALKIEILKYADGRFGFDWQADSYERKRVRKTLLVDAEKEAKELLGATRAGTVDLLKIDPDEYAEFLRWKAERRQSVPVPTVVADFLASKRTKGRSVKHINGLEYTLNAFAKDFTGPIDQLKGVGVEAWLEGRKVGPRRWNNLLADIVSMILFARRTGVLSSEITQIEQIERKEVTYTVLTYTPEELEKLLNACRHEWRPALVLSAFCGLRPEELYPERQALKRKTRTDAIQPAKPGLMWEHIRWDKGIVDVPAAVSKTRRRRWPVLTDAAKAWLADWRAATGPVAPATRFWTYLPTLEAKAGVDWKPDALRHSFASYRLAITKDVPALALEMGNSATMIFRHYLDLKDEAEAKRWFEVRPKMAQT